MIKVIKTLGLACGRRGGGLGFYFAAGTDPAGLIKKILYDYRMLNILNHSVIFIKSLK